MGLLDDIIAQQSGGGMLGGLPASWQYTNPESLTPVQKQMMGLVGTQNPEQVGFNPLPASTGAFPAGGATPIAGLPQAATPPAPTFGAGASPTLFANPPGTTPGNPALPSPTTAPPIADGVDEEDLPAPNTPASPLAIGGYQMPRIGPATAFTPDPAALPVNAQSAQGQLPVAPAAPSIGDKLMTGYQNIHHGGGLIGSIVAAVTGKRNDAAGIAQEQQLQVANMTARALIAKNVPPEIAIAAVQPGNGELLKTLFDANFKPKDPMNLGSGYVLRPGAAKAERLYEPDEKTPAGFATDSKGMRYVPGGPADPAYLRLAEAQKKDPNANIVLGRGGEIVKNNPDGSVTVMHKNESEAPVPMDPASLEILARREIGGDFSGRKNLGRGAQGAADLKAITNKSSEILTNEMGMSPTDAAGHLLKKQQEYNAQGQGLNSEARTTGVREANLNLILKAADAAIPAALEASDKVSRTGWVPLNKIIQGGQVATSDPALKSFGMANLQLAEHWARAMNPTGVMRESDRDKALSFLSTADSKETYKTAVNQLRTQIERERDAVKSSRGMSDLPGASSSATAPKSPVKIDGYTITEH